MDRIEINGVWYVKETETTKEEKIILDLVDFIGCSYENDDYAWEATKIYKDVFNDVLYDGVDIKFTDKTVKPWKEDHWDNNTWILGVYNNNPESMPDAKEMMNDKGIKHFRAFIKALIDKGWFNHE